MRSNQFSVGVMDVKTQRRIISVYADANNFYEALWAAFNETVLVIKKMSAAGKMPDGEKSAYIGLWYTDLKDDDGNNIFPINSVEFRADSENIFEAVVMVFNNVLNELQKEISLPSFGRKEHYDDDAPKGYRTVEAQPDFVFINDERLEGPDITIPDGYLHIMHRVFREREDIATIHLPDGVTYIGSYAFENCSNLREIRIPDSLRAIGGGAFCKCGSLESIDIPIGVKKLYFFTFHGCESLKKVVLPNSELTIHGHVFNFCTALEEITITAKTVRIDSDAFTGCSALQNIFVDDENAFYSDIDGVLYSKDLSKLIIYPEGRRQKDFSVPESVVEIGEEAFSGCANLETIYIPSGVEKISHIAFYVWSNAGCKGYVQIHDGVVNIFVDEQNTAYADTDGVLFNKDKTVLLKYPKGRKQASYAVPDGVTEIANHAFEHNTAISSVTFPESLTKIGFNAFGGCSKLEKISIPKNIPAMDRPGFEETAWYAAQPDGMVYFGDAAFKYKGKMPENFIAHIKEGTKLVMQDAFVNQRNLLSVTLPDSLIEIEKYAFNCCHNLAEIALPQGDVKIAEGAFYQSAYERNKNKK